MRDAKNGTYNGETTFCPVNGWDCPYFKNGVCHVDDPQEDCDDWQMFFESWEEWLALDDVPDYEPCYDAETGFNPYLGCYDDDC